MRPRVSTVPESGRMMPLMSLSSVLLPEPLSPIRPMDSPCWTVNETPSSALNLLLSSCPRRAATDISLSVRW